MTGSIQQKNGKYYAVINLTDINGKRKQKWINTGYEIKGNKKNAEKFLRDKLKEYELNENLIPSDVLFSDYIRYWLSNAEIRLDKITYQGYCSIANAHIIPYFESLGIPLKEVKTETIQKYVNEKSKNGKLKGDGGLSPKSIKTHMIVIKQTLKEAVKNHLILVNPCDNVNLPKMQRREPNFYNYSDLQNMFAELKNEELFPLLYFTVLFGLRRSEVLGLKWDSVNFETNTLTIKHTVVRFNEVVEKDQTKNKSSYRSYPITDEIREILISLKKQEETNRKFFGNEYIENDYIFKWANGKPYAPDFVTMKFSKLLKQHNLPHIRFHDLRHSCASLLIAKGFQLKDVSEWLGHADIQTTANIYGHLDIERKNKIANAMSNTFDF